MPISCAQWLTVTLFGFKIPMRNNSFVKVTDIPIAEEDNGAHGFLCRIKGRDRVFIKLRNRIGVEYDGKIIPMTAVNTLNNIPLGWHCGHSGAWSYSLDIDNNERYLHHVGQSYALLHQRESRTRGGRHRLKASQGCADNGVNGCNLVLHLEHLDVLLVDHLVDNFRSGGNGVTRKEF